MIKLGMKIPNNIWVACSGGVDSMAALRFLSNKTNRKVRVAYMNHGTSHGADAEKFVREHAFANDLEIKVGTIARERMPRESPEEYWRLMRYDFLHSLDGTVVSAHHLDDAVEQWIFSSLNGKPDVMPTSNKNVVRPFMLNTKQCLKDYCFSTGTPWIEDGSNADPHYARNRIRHNIVPQAMMVNPGLHKVIRKIVEKKYEEANDGVAC